METFDVTCIVLFVIAISLQSVNGIQCYQCDYSNSNCKDPFDSSGVSKVSCPGSCSKMKGERSGAQVVIRGCLPSIGAENKCEEVTNDGVKGQACLCSSNLCNGVLPVAGSFVVLASSFIIYIALF